MPILVGIHLTSGQISTENIKTKKWWDYRMEGGYVQDENVREKLIQAKDLLGKDVKIVYTIFVMPAVCNSESRRNLLTTAAELGFGECGIISNEAACCITSISKFNIKLEEGERIAIIQKKVDGLACNYWQKIGRQIKSYQKSFLVNADEKREKLKIYLKKYAFLTLIDESVDNQIIEETFKDVPHRIMKHTRNYWSTAALLKAGMNYFKNSETINVPDFVEKKYKIMYEGKSVKEFDRPCLPFKTNVSMVVRGRNGKLKIYESGKIIMSLSVPNNQEEVNIEFSLDNNGILTVDVGSIMPHRNASDPQNNLNNKSINRRQASRRSRRGLRNKNVQQQNPTMGNVFNPEKQKNGRSEAANLNNNQNYYDEIPSFECIVCFVEYDEDDGCFKCSYWAKGNPNKSHAICRECLQGHAEATIYNTPIVPEADGIRCVEHGCENVFLLAKICKYLSMKTSEALLKRMQRESILLASEKSKLSELMHECENCGHQGWIDKNYPTSICRCGKEICNFCFQPYDIDHRGKTCDEAAEELKKKNKAKRNIEEQISECIIRKCPRCKKAFVKEYGCNKMTCICGALSCYLCNAANIDYEHFCKCPTPDGIVGKGICPNCFKRCRLFEDANARDQEKIQNILKNRDIPNIQIPPRLNNPEAQLPFAPRLVAAAQPNPFQLRVNNQEEQQPPPEPERRKKSRCLIM